MSSDSKVSTTIFETARLRNHLWSEGITYHGAVLGAGAAQGVFIGRRVLRPKLPLGIIGLADLPVPRRIVQPPLEPPELFFRADVQEELEDVGAVGHQTLLELVDLLVALRPDLLGDEVVDADHQDVFVVGAVEDDDFALRGRLAVDAPEEVVGRLVMGGDLEAVDAGALRVHVAQHVVDDAVLAGRIDAPGGR